MKGWIKRREFLATVTEAAGFLGLLLWAPTKASAALGGTWKVRCPNGHDDLVHGGTCQHRCETCGVQAFNGTTVTVVCPVGHPNMIDSGPCDRDHPVTSFNCATCGRECRIPEPPPPREHGGRG